MNLIEELRQRPEEERLAFAAIAAGVVALILFLVWGITFFRSATNTTSITVANQQGSALEGLQNASQDVQSSFETLSAQYAQLQAALADAESMSNMTAGTEAVELSVDEDGTVHVNNIIIEKDELGNE